MSSVHDEADAFPIQFRENDQLRALFALHAEHLETSPVLAHWTAAGFSTILGFTLPRAEASLSRACSRPARGCKHSAARRVLWHHCILFRSSWVANSIATTRSHARMQRRATYLRARRILDSCRKKSCKTHALLISLASHTRSIALTHS